MGIISVEQADRLYWLGRYAERTYTTIRIFFHSFDKMIDEVADHHEQFCKMVDIPDVYKDKDDFRQNYPFDENNPDSIISNLTRAYDNAIVLRESIGSDTLSLIQLAVYEMQRAKESKAPLIELQRVQDDIMAFWGMADDFIDDERTRNIIKAGKRMERVDLYARLGADKKELLREIHRMVPRIQRSGLPYHEEKIKEILECMEQPETDFYRIVSDVNQIF